MIASFHRLSLKFGTTAARNRAAKSLSKHATIRTAESLADCMRRHRYTPTAEIAEASFVDVASRIDPDVRAALTRQLLLDDAIRPGAMKALLSKKPFGKAQLPDLIQSALSPCSVMTLASLVESFFESASPSDAERHLEPGLRAAVARRLGGELTRGPFSAAAILRALARLKEPLAVPLLLDLIRYDQTFLAAVENSPREEKDRALIRKLALSALDAIDPDWVKGPHGLDGLPRLLEMDMPAAQAAAIRILETQLVHEKSGPRLVDCGARFAQARLTLTRRGKSFLSLLAPYMILMQGLDFYEGERITESMRTDLSGWLQEISPEWWTLKTAQTAVAPLMRCTQQAMGVADRIRALRILARIPGQDSLRAVIESAGDPSPEVQKVGDSLLAGIPDWERGEAAKGAVPCLARHVMNPQAGPRDFEKIARHPDYWDDKNHPYTGAEHICVGASRRLGQIGDRSAIRPLILGLRYGRKWDALDDEYVESAILGALNEIDPGWRTRSEARSVIPQLILDLSRLAIREQAMDALLHWILRQIDPKWPSTDEAWETISQLIEEFRATGGIKDSLGLALSTNCAGLISRILSENKSRDDFPNLAAKAEGLLVPYHAKGIKI